MDGTAMAWVIGGYLAGTFPSTLVLARLRHAEELEAASGRRAGETDPHILATKFLGAGWSSLASATDVLKALHFGVQSDLPVAERIAMLRRAILKDPSNPSLYSNLGDVYASAGRDADAA